MMILLARWPNDLNLAGCQNPSMRLPSLEAHHARARQACCPTPPPGQKLAWLLKELHDVRHKHEFLFGKLPPSVSTQVGVSSIQLPVGAQPSSMADPFPGQPQVLNLLDPDSLGALRQARQIL